MATVQVAYFSPVNIGGTSIYPANPESEASITSSASSQQSGVAATAGQYARVTSQGGGVYAAGGSNPTASSTNGWLVTDGASIDIGPLRAGWTVAVIDAT